eukprot:contig_13564_g3252
MGCTAFLDEVDSVTGGVNVTAAVFNLKLQSERSFFGSGVFETTAVVVAVFVAAYVVVPDPTGTQHAQDLSEYSVYAQWRWAMLILIADLGFTLAVIVHQLIECWRGSDVLWLVLLMFAPWAPVARQVFLTFAAWSRVRTMMRARMVSNTLTAVLREGFYLGYPGLSMGTVGVHFFHMKALPVPSPGGTVSEQRLLVLQTHSVCRRVNNTVRSHLKPTPFWNLFWDSMRSKLSRASPMGSMSKVLSDRTVEQLMEDALADTVDKHVGNVVKELCETFIDPSDYPPSKSDCIGLARLCDVDSCILHQPKSLIT